MIATTKELFAELTIDNVKTLQCSLNRKILIIKFGADWCRPCKAIKETCETWFTKMPENAICADIDIDESLDLYMAFKTKKMVKGVPTILAFHGDILRDHWFIPDDSVSGGDINTVNAFFERCLAKANSFA